jgi:UDP-glucose 4-epimerase
MEPMHVLVVGGAGYIGSHVVLALMDAGHKVTVFDDLSTGRRMNLFEGNGFVEGDIRQMEPLKSLFAATQFDAIVHLAALKAAGDSMTDPQTFADHNIAGSINLINLAVAHGVRNVIFSSSAATYGDPQYLPMDEQHQLDPANFYGFTKLKIEEILAWYSRLGKLHYASLRYFNAAGFDGQGRVKGLEMKTQNLIPLVMEAAIGKREKLAIFGEDYETRDGTCIRDYVHVTDLAEAHVKALQYTVDHDCDFVANLGSETGYTVKEVIENSRRITGKPIPADAAPRRAGDPPSLVASSGYAQKTLNWQPQHSSLENIIATTWQVYRDYGDQQ